ncbi:MAG: hypothetical protein GXO47_09730 [Chlorobi bacterium]|nr:hypothetical protein [Chlorobiota bacterium]
MKTVFQIILTIAILYLGYLVYDSINRPIQFQKEYNKRKEAVIKRLEEIRDVEVAYKSVYEKYTGSFDTLVNFLKNDSLPLVRKIGSLTDSMLEAGMTESKALALGIIKRDTIKVAVKDSLFKVDYPIDSLPYVPYSGGVKFELGAGVVKTGSGVKVHVFECKTPNNVFLKGLNKQEIINLNDKAVKLERYPGLKVGSLEEANNNAGNWE